MLIDKEQGGGYMNLSLNSVTNRQLSLILAIEQSKGIIGSPDAVLVIAQKFNKYLDESIPHQDTSGKEQVTFQDH